MTIKRSGLLYEPLGPCQWKAELLTWDRVAKTDIIRQGASGVLLLVDVAAGKNFDKHVPLNFSVFGSSIGQETETKPLKAGRVIFGESKTTRNRVQSPSNASNTLSGLALCANMTETSYVTAINEQGGKETQDGNDEWHCSAGITKDRDIRFGIG